MSLSEQNLRHLCDRFFTGTDAPRAVAMVLGKRGSPWLKHVLRSHLVEPIEGEEVAIRDHLDQLLAFYGILELAAAIGLIRWPLPHDLEREANEVLKEPSVERYYGKLYPVLLPLLFRWRLEGRPLVEYGAFEDEAGDLEQLLTISDILDDAEVAQFLWFLDDGKNWDKKKRAWVGLADFFQVLTKPASLARRLTSVNDRSPVSQATRGFPKFLSFAQSLDALLAKSESQPILQSLLWHHHAYWFYQLSGQVAGVLAAGIEEFREYVDEDDVTDSQLDRHDAVLDTHTLMDEAHIALTRLTSSLYRAPLEQAYLARATTIVVGAKGQGRHGIERYRTGAEARDSLRDHMSSPGEAHA